MENQIDKQVQDLFKIVQAKKAEIAKAEKPNWITNGSFRFNRDSSASTNIQVVADVDVLVEIMAFLLEKEGRFAEANKELGTNSKFKWLGFTTEDWKSDLQSRINKILITNKKKELENLESRLDNLVSPELKRQMELEEITKQLLG